VAQALLPVTFLGPQAPSLRVASPCNDLGLLLAFALANSQEPILVLDFLNTNYQLLIALFSWKFSRS
jgi:hypothetical protein